MRCRAISTKDNLLVADRIHAVAAVDPVFGREPEPLFRVGHPASRYIARQVVSRAKVGQVGPDPSWLIARLGFDHSPIEVVPAAAIRPAILLWRDNVD